MLSKTSKYGVRAILYLAKFTNVDRLLGVKELAIAIEISEPMLSKVMQRLTKMKLVDSKKGRNGGFFMTDSQKNDTLMNAIKLMEQSEHIISGCLLGQKTTGECKVCPYKLMVRAIRAELQTIYNSDTILETANKLYIH